jgi:hypothetical protein
MASYIYKVKCNEIPFELFFENESLAYEASENMENLSSKIGASCTYSVTRHPVYYQQDLYRDFESAAEKHGLRFRNGVFSKLKVVK